MKLFAPFIIVKAFSVIVDVKASNEEWMVYLSIKNYDVTHGYINPQLLASFTPIWKEKAIKNAVKGTITLFSIFDAMIYPSTILLHR